jgi:acetate kinase
LVFTGGIGENAAPIRARVCDRLGFLGIQLDHRRNDASEAIISAQGAPVVVRVVHTDEERVIAEAVVALVHRTR